MTSLRRRIATVASGVALLLGAAGLSAAPASAATVNGDGTLLQFSGTGGDFISQDQGWSYDPGNAAFSADVSPDHRSLRVGVQSSTWWTVDLVAPEGQALTPGTTYQATRAPFQSPTTGGFDLSGDGRGCNESTSTFTVQDAVFGTNGWIEKFSATFEQHCENGTSYAYGKVVLVNGPAPAPLAMKAAVTSAKVSRSGIVTLTGTVTCNEQASVSVGGSLRQRVNRKLLASGDWGAGAVDCTTTPKPWTATVLPNGTVPFAVGSADLSYTLGGLDPVYGGDVSTPGQRTVKLSK